MTIICTGPFACCAAAHLEELHLKVLGAALLFVCRLAITVTPGLALQTFVMKVDTNPDESMTYHFTVKLESSETLTTWASKATADFVTVYNFYGLVDRSAKSPPGWKFSSEEFGRTPTLNGYPMVLPLDVPNTPNLTWTVTKPAATGEQTDGFTASTHVTTTVQGEYSAQVTRQELAIQGAAARMPGVAAKASQQALIGALATPSFLAEVK